MQKRAPAASSSGQPSQPMKRPCCAPVNQEWKGSEMKLEPRSCLIEEDVQRVCGQNRDLAEFHSADCCQSCIGNALKHIVERMYSMEISFQKLREDLATIHYPHLVRANAKSMAKNDVRNLQLQFRTKLSLPLFTGKKIEGEGGARIEVALIDAKTGGVVTSGPESSIKLEVVVLEGDFNKDNWIQEEFENYVVKEREGKRPLLVGNLQVTLNEGVGQLGELTFTDNSSWNRSKSFRIGLRLASGYCGSARIREAKTDAFPVKEHRGESYMKRHPPVSDDEVWRLEKIAKDGKFHQKLSEAGIHKVEDFLLQHFIDSKKLKEILGKSITLRNWDILVDHAKTCKTNWKLYYTDGMRKHGAVFNTNRQLIALIKDSARFAAHQLSTQEKELGYTIVKEAFDNWNSVREFDGETFSDSVQKKSSSSSPSQVFEGQIENLTPVQCKLAQRICAAPVGLEAPPANASSTAERYTGVTALALPGQSEDTNSGNAMEVTVEDIFRFLERQPTDEDSLNVQNSIIGLPTQSHDINFQCQTIDSLSQMDHTENQNVLPFEPPDGSTSSSQFSSTLPLPEGNDEDFRSAISDDNIEDWFARFIRNLPDDYRFFQTPPDDDTFLQTVPYEYEDTFVRTPPYVYEDKFFQTPPDDDRLFEIPPYYDTFFQNPPYDDGGVRGTSVIVNGWLKIEAVTQWGFSIRKRGVRIVQLDEPSIEVQA